MKAHIHSVVIDVDTSDQVTDRPIDIWRGGDVKSYPLTLRNYWRAVGLQLRLAGLEPPVMQQYRRYRAALDKFHAEIEPDRIYPLSIDEMDNDILQGR